MDRNRAEGETLARERIEHASTSIASTRHRWFNPGIVYIARVSAFDTCRSNSPPQNAKRMHVHIS